MLLGTVRRRSWGEVVGEMIKNDFEELIVFLQKFVAKRGWKLKLAKKEPIEQSLFIHSINELGAIKSYLENFPHPFNNTEIIKLYIASITHDCEKETDEWQEKISFGEKPPYHTNPEYAKKFVDDLLNFLKKNGINVDFDQNDINDIISSQSLHMKASAKKPINVFDEMSRDHKSERWSEIAYLVDLFDDIVSIESVESLINVYNKDEYRMLTERLEFAYHKISNVRGILTSLLHKACEKVYERHGFKPFLYFVDGTIYFMAKNEKNKKIPVNEIKDSMKDVLNEFIHNMDHDSKVIIENPQTKLFRGKEFFDKDLIDKYFFSLRRKYRPKVDKGKLIKLIKSSFNSLENAKGKFNLQEIEDSEIIETIMQNVETLSEKFPKFIKEFQEIYNIDISKPQQYNFQLFKEIMTELNLHKDIIKNIEMEYDSFFGIGAYNNLAKLTNNPEKNFGLFVKPYWEKEIYFNNNKMIIKNFNPKKQEEYLAKKLCNILKNNFEKCSKLPKDYFVDDIVTLLISDLVYPYNLHVEKIESYAKEQLQNIGNSKVKLFNKSKGKRLCPICYKMMSEANPITAGFLSEEKGVAKVFNNQAIGGSSFGGSVNICKLCYAELLIRRIVLGRTPSDLIILFPSLNFEKIQGSNVLELMRDLQNKLEQFYSYHNPNLNERIRFNDFRNLTSQLLEKKTEEISSELNPKRFIETFNIKIGDKRKKDDIKKIEPLLKNLFDSVDEFNKEFSTDYKNFNQIATDIFENKCVHKDTHEYKNIPEIERNQIIEEAKVNPVRYSFVYETPNFIVIYLPTTFGYTNAEAEVNILLKRLLFASYLYLLTDCAVMIIPGKEIIHISNRRKMIYVQPNATLKQVLKEDWISLSDTKKWMIAISAAVRLACQGNYSDRSGIFEILTQPTVGHILSRITSQKTQSGAPRRPDSKLINILENLKNTEVLKNETIVDTKI